MHSCHRTLNLFLEEDSGDGAKATRFIRQLNPETRATLEALSKEYKEPTSSSVSMLTVQLQHIVTYVLADIVHMANKQSILLMFVQKDKAGESSGASGSKSSVASVS